MFYGFNKNGEYVFSSSMYGLGAPNTVVVESDRHYDTSSIKLVNGEIVELEPELDADMLESKEESINLDPVLVLESIISMQNQLDEISKSKE